MSKVRLRCSASLDFSSYGRQNCNWRVFRGDITTGLRLYSCKETVKLRSKSKRTYVFEGLEE